MAKACGTATVCLAVVCTAPTGCSSRASEPGPVAGELPIELGSIELVGWDPEPPPRAWVRGVFDGLLGPAPRFEAADGDDDPLSASLRLHPYSTPSGTEVLRVDLQVEPPPEVARVFGSDFGAIVELERPAGGLAAERDVAVGLQRALGLVDAKLLLSRGGVEDLAQLLAASDPEVVLLALDLVRQHRTSAVADAIVPLLRHSDERVVLAAVETLGRVGSHEHVGPLVRWAKLADRAHANRLYDAVAALGGPEAEGFLRFAAQNEDDPMLAEVAARALQRLESGAELEPTVELSPAWRGSRQ